MVDNRRLKGLERGKRKEEERRGEGGETQERREIHRERVEAVEFCSISF